MHPNLFSIPAHRAFADSLAAGLIARFGKAPAGLAGGLLLLPNQRASRAVQDAFLRRSEGGLLLPRMIVIGDPDLGERVGSGLEEMAGEEPIPPAIEPLERLMLLTRLIQIHQRKDAAESLRLAEELARTLDQLLFEEVDPARLADFAADVPEMSLHWQKSLDQMGLILKAWPDLLSQRGQIDLADRRNRLLAQVRRRWRTAPPAGFVCAAGITTSARAVARLLRQVAALPQGMVVLPGLDLRMPEEEWDSLGPPEASQESERPAPGRPERMRSRSCEGHPQFHLKLLLQRMGVGRLEVRQWRRGSGHDAPAVRSRAIAHAMAPAEFTRKWQILPARERRLTGLRALELADPAEEAQAIAIALREALETPGRTAALVTPDRALARRVSAHLRRWGIEADDSAGRPLSQTPPGTLLLALATAAAERFAPVPLLALLKHPLVRAGDERLDWLDGVRALDLALRGPRPPAGLNGLADHLRSARGAGAAATFWSGILPLLEPLERAFAQTLPLPELLAAIREAAGRLVGEQMWAGPAGRAAGDLFTGLETASREGPEQVGPTEFPILIEQIMSGVAVRPPFGQHPRIFIWGLLEARLQQADLMILGGLNEGIWPALPAPDPWLAPRLRAELGLPSLERRIGLAAHDFVGATGAPRVIVTRARRDARSPAIASRFWLRLEAMTGGVTRMPELRSWARQLDRPHRHAPAKRPEPRPEQRPRDISVTEVDRLKADPFAFYARRILNLQRLDAIDADPSAAWRGSAVHLVLEQWLSDDDCDPARLRPRAEELLAGASSHPLMRALWQPRLMEAVDFLAAEVEKNRMAGRRPTAAEAEGRCEVAGIRLRGRADRIDRCGDGSLVIIDYKTGKPPTAKAVAEGFALQLGLLGLIAERGGFSELEGAVSGFEYWSLGKKNGNLGYVENPAAKLIPADFISAATAHFSEAADKWLTGDAPFTAKIRPEYAPYDEYDQLMRLDEWYGREG